MKPKVHEFQNIKNIIMSKNIILIAALAISIVFVSCNSNKKENHGEETEHHDEHENTNTAMLTAEQMKSIKIEPK